MDGRAIGSCLGDVYSVNWMEDSDKASEQASESLKGQYEVFNQPSLLSHVC